MIYILSITVLYWIFLVFMVIQHPQWTKILPRKKAKDVFFAVIGFPVVFWIIILCLYILFSTFGFVGGLISIPIIGIIIAILMNKYIK